MIINIATKEMNSKEFNENLRKEELVKLEANKDKIEPNIYTALNYVLSTPVEDLESDNNFTFAKLLGVISMPNNPKRNNILRDYVVTYLALKFSVLKDKDFSDCAESIYIAITMIEDDISLSKIGKYTDLTDEELETIDNFIVKIIKPV